jgi:hypothetical protein
VPKPANQLSTEQVTLSATGRVVSYLEELVATGLYGKNRAEAAYRLVEQELRRLVEQGILGSDQRKKNGSRLARNRQLREHARPPARA